MKKKVSSSLLQPVFPLSNSKKCKPQEPNSPTLSINNDNSDEKMITRFQKNAKTCGICYMSIEKQVNKNMVIVD